MSDSGWQYYNHAMIPTTPPHQIVDISVFSKSDFWKKGALFARYTTNFDCGYETNWWYVIKDAPFDISALKAKRRYEINKGLKNFDVQLIDSLQYAEEIFNVSQEAYRLYPEAYRPNIDHDSFVEDIKKWNTYKVYGAFHKETGVMCGYARLIYNEKCLDFMNLKSNPDYESLAVNAAIVSKILDDSNDFLSTGGYICDGERNILHQTAFQDYLEKYFGFRKAYCKLNIKFNPRYKVLIKLMYHLRFLLKPFKSNAFVAKMFAVFSMYDLAKALSDRKVCVYE